MANDDKTPDADREWLINQIAHALRNPIFAATVQTEALQLRSSDPYAVRTTTEKLHGQLERLSECIDEMLLFGRPIRGHFEDIAVADVINTLVTAYSTGDRQVPAQVTADIVDGGLIGRWDRNVVIVILERLLDNAVQHTETPHEVHLAVEATNQGTIVFSVIDHGDGIPAEILDRALLPFFPQHRGRPGLGLAVADKFARYLGGRIRVESTEGQGTTVRCELPVRFDG